MSAVFGPDWPGLADLEAARTATFEALANPFLPYAQYAQAAGEAEQTSAAYIRGVHHRVPCTEGCPDLAHEATPDGEVGLTAGELAVLEQLTAAGAVGVMDVTAEPDAEPEAG